METFETIFENARQEPVTVFDGPHPLLVLFPGRSKPAESASPVTLYARWSRLTFLPGDEIEFTLRPGFEEPDRGRWVVEALNVEGRDIEQRAIGGRNHWLPRKIPVLIPVSPEDPEAVYRALRIEQTDEWLDVPGFRGYLVKESRLVDRWTKRNSGDLNELARLQQKAVDGLAVEGLGQK